MNFVRDDAYILRFQVLEDHHEFNASFDFRQVGR